jgi:hypothetical protein
MQIIVNISDSNLSAFTLTATVFQCSGVSISSPVPATSFFDVAISQQVIIEEFANSTEKST